MLITNLIVLNEQASSPQDLTTPLFHTSLIVQDAQVACNILLPSLAAPADLTAQKALQSDLINLPDLLPPPHHLASIVQVALKLKLVHLTNLLALHVQVSSLIAPLAHLSLLSLIVLVDPRLALVLIAQPALPSNLISPQESNVRATLLCVPLPLHSLREDRTNLKEVTTPLKVPITGPKLPPLALPKLSEMSSKSQEILTVCQLRSAWLEARFSRFRPHTERG